MRSERILLPPIARRIHPLVESSLSRRDQKLLFPGSVTMRVVLLFSFSIFSGAMDFLLFLVDFIVHIDRHLAELAAAYGPWLFLILFLIIFAETGLVVTPILPGDSLLFVTGAMAATGAFDIHLMVLVLIVAAILGDSVNYQISTGPIHASSSASIWSARMRSMNVTAARPSSLRALRRLCGLLHRSLPVSAQ